MKKKILSLLLACCMLVCLIPTSVFAEDCEHVYTDWEIEYNATCAHEGLKTRECTLCGYLDEEVIEKTEEHDWGPVRISKYADFERDGEKVRYCKNCHKKTVDEIVPMVSKVYLSQDTFVYDGTEKKPTIYYVDRNNNIIPSKYYSRLTLSYTCLDIGTYWINPSLNLDAIRYGYRSCRVELPCRIIPKNPKNKVPISEDNAFTARWSKISKKAASGYQVQYSRNSNMTKAKKKNVSGATKTKVKIKKLKSKKKYYVRVRTYKKVNGKKVYSKWSAKKSVKTK